MSGAGRDDSRLTSFQEKTVEKPVDKKLFEELAQTGALKIPPDEAESLLDELNDRLTVIHQLETIPLEDAVRPVVHGNPYPPEIRCELRKDEWIPFAAPAEIIDRAPHSEEGYIVSPDVVHLSLRKH